MRSQVSNERIPPGFWIGLIMIVCILCLQHCSKGGVAL